MTSDEKMLAIALSGCVFVPGTATKRFARNMGFGASQDESPELTKKQRAYLVTAVIRYRRQIEPFIVALAREMLKADSE